jgi:hypothetical protein
LRYPPYRRVGQNLKPEVPSWVKLLYKGLPKKQSLKLGAKHHTFDRSPPKINFRKNTIFSQKINKMCIVLLSKARYPSLRSGRRLTRRPLALRLGVIKKERLGVTKKRRLGVTKKRRLGVTKKRRLGVTKKRRLGVTKRGF